MTFSLLRIFLFPIFFKYLEIDFEAKKKEDRKHLSKNVCFLVTNIFKKNHIGLFISAELKLWFHSKSDARSGRKIKKKKKQFKIK